MTYDDVVKLLAPCGLNCTRCADFNEGDIKQLSINLQHSLGNYEWVAKVKAVRNPVMEHYPQFADVLASFAQVSCGGCRSDNIQCTIKCTARSCAENKRVDFCFQCNEYPCEDPGPNRDRWIKINDRMKEIGVVK